MIKRVVCLILAFSIIGFCVFAGGNTEGPVEIKAVDDYKLVKAGEDNKSGKVDFNNYNIVTTIAPLMDPDLITKQDTRTVWMDTRIGSTYGLSCLWKTGGNLNDWGSFEGPDYVRECEIVYDLDSTAFRTFISALYTKF